ncbi:two-partner secretion domain-containing protein [Dryocola clanedunensis]|uniref:two-partner secretion domain-containing protein n=1 Tax=Dryocola clanedunensis TaxID=2925396 RepID=UPI0038CBF668
MNKHFYRIIFNQARGMMVVVAEITRSHRAGVSPSPASVNKPAGKLLAALSPLTFGILLSFAQVTSVQAGIVADKSAPGGQQAQIINSANGTPQVNIQTPSAAGVSRNTYSQFDVDKKGAILNNSHKNVETRLGGMVAANQNLVKGEAKIILNEVNARDPSRLNGYIEVAGQKAQVVIANPSGISCDGCGFINANRATLTTGQVQMNNGQITGYDVNKGDIVVQGAGMDSGSADSTDLIGRAVKMNAGVWAKELKVTAGRNVVDAVHNTVRAKAADSSTAPTIAIDVSSLGGMYANKIRLIGTEKGVGVHNAGSIGASAGDVAISADGTLSNSGAITASQSLQLTTQGGLNNQGTLYASTDTTVKAAGNIHNAGIIAAQRNTGLTGRSINSTAAGTLAAGMKDDGSLGTSGDLTLNGQGELVANGQNAAAGTLTARGSSVNLDESRTSAHLATIKASAGDITTRHATVAAKDKLTLSGSKTLDNTGGTLSASQLELTARSLTNQQGTVQQLGTQNLTLSFADDLDNTGGTLATNSNAFTLNAGRFTNRGGNVVHTGTGALVASAGQMNGENGQLFSNGDLTLHATGLILDNAVTQAEHITLTADTLSHRQGNLSQTGGGDMSVTVDKTLDNTGGSIAANGNVTLKAGSLNNQSGTMKAANKGNLAVATGAANNQQGSLAADGALSLHGTSLNNDGGLLQSGDSMQLNLANGALSNRNSGQTGGILSLGALDIRAGALGNSLGFIGSSGNATLTLLSLNNRQGTLSSDGSLSLHSGAVDNQNGLIQTAHMLTLNAQGNTLTNTSGLLSAGEAMTLQSGALINQSGDIHASGDLTLNTQDSLLDNTHGSIAAAGNMQLDTGGLDNAGGQIQAIGNAVISARNATFDNTAGLLRSNNALTLNAASFINHDTLGDNTGAEGSTITIISQRVDNSDGRIRATDALGVAGIKTLDNRRGLLSSAGTLTIDGSGLALTNTDGTLIAGRALSLTADSLTGDGDVLSQGNMALALQKALINQGRVMANGDMQFNLGSVGLINQGLIKAGSKLTLNAAALENRQDAEITAGENHLLLTGDVTNRGLIDGGLTHIVAGTLTNTGTGRLYGDHVALQAKTLNNQAENDVAATIAARDEMDLGVGTLNNSDHALIYSDGDLAVGGSLNENLQATGRAEVFTNHSATLESMRDMTLNIDQINNYNDRLVTKDVQVSQTDYHTAVLKGATDYFNWDDIDTSTQDKYSVRFAIMPDGTKGREFYEYRYTETINETQVVESDPGKIIAGGNLTINSRQVNNHDSQIVAGGVLGGLVAELNNIATQGKRVITDVGSVTRWYSKKSHNWNGTTKTSQGTDTDDYRPDPTLQTIDLLTMKWQGNTRPDGSGARIDGRDTSGDHTTIINAGEVNANTGQTPITPPPGETVEVVQPGDDGTVIRIITPDTTLPDNSLYQLHPAPDAGYLVETDPRFTNAKKWLSGDYMQDALQTDHNATLKRLGDGYYEQQLVRQQVISLSGERYFEGYSNDEEEYKALMDAGIAYAKQYGLNLGVALTPAQMALLTTDMVWLVAQNVTLPDGSVQSVLVPQVYARVKQGDLDGSGALLGGHDIALNISRDLTNSGHINGRGITQVTADNINNNGFIGGGQVSLAARTDINNIGGTLQGGDSLVAVAGRDINSVTTLGGGAGNITLDRPAGIYVQNDSGELGLQALRNINLTGSLVSNAGANGQTQIVAGNDLNLNTITTTGRESADWGHGNDRSLTSSSDVGSQITVNGDVALSAGHDVNTRAATVSATKGLSVTAGNDIRLDSGEASFHLTENSHQRSGGLLSSKSVTMHDEVQATNAVGSNFGGDTIAMQAGNDLRVSGSSVAGTHDVSLSAGHNLTVTTAEETRQESHLRKEKHSGLSGTGGVGVSVGSSSMKVTDDANIHSSSASTVGSSQGNVTLNAGNALTVEGSKVLAGKDMALSGKEVNILAAENQSARTHTVEQKTSGLTLALSGMVGSAINTAVSSATDASNESNSRLAALDGIQSALSGAQAWQASQTQSDASNPQGSMIGVNLSYGSQSSKSTQKQTQNDSQGSSLMAGSNLSVHATGTDLNVQGSQLQAGGNVVLNAARDVSLLSAENNRSLTGKNESHGGSVGVGINFGQGANGLTVSASANKSKGHETGNGTSHTESTVSAGNKVTLVSGRDATLTGAQVSGNQVTMDIGHNLTMTSEQDSDDYDSKQQSASAGGSVSMGGGSGSLNLSQSKMHSTWDSVEEQTGIFVGKGGFDVTVGNHTQLDGAVIGSTAAAEHNKLDTGTLGFSDIKNRAEYSVEQQSVGVSSSGSVGSQFLGNMASGLLVGAGGKGSDSSMTRSAVSDGTLIVRDQTAQKQDVAGLSRDADHANQALSPIFDKEKEQSRLKEAQKIGEIGSQMGDVIAKQGELNKEKALKDPDARKAAKEQLAGKGNINPSEAQIDAQIGRTTTADYDIGGKYQQVAQAVTAALQGVAGGNMAQAVAGAASPYVADVIHSQTMNADGTTNLATNAMAHAVWGAIAAAAGENNAVAGATGAVSGELMGRYVASELYPGVDPKDMTGEQKATISALGTLAAGLAGGVTGGDVANAVAGAQTGRNAVDNNAMGDGFKLPEGLKNYTSSQGSLSVNTNILDDNGKVLNPMSPDAIDKAVKDQASGIGTGAAQPATGLVKAWGAGMTAVVAPELLPSEIGAVTIAGGGLIGGGANLTNQMLQGGPISATDVLIATGTGAFSKGIGGTFAPSIISATGAYVGAELQNRDPIVAVTGSVIGSVTGGAAAKGFEYGNRLKPVFQPNTAPVISDISGALSAEAANSKYTNAVQDAQGKNEKTKDGN